MIDLSELEMLGGQLRALKEAEKLLEKQPVKLYEDEVKLAELRAAIRGRRKALKLAVEKVQLRLAF